MSVALTDLFKLFSAVDATLSKQNQDAEAGHYLAEAMRRVQPTSAPDMALVMRCALFAQVILHESDALEEAQLVAKSVAAPTALVISPSLAHACSVVPLAISMVNESISPNYDLQELLRAGRDHLSQVPQATLQMPGHRPMKVNATLTDRLLDNLGTGNVGDHLRELNSKAGPIDLPDMKREDYPSYFRAMDERTKVLMGLPSEVAAQFTVVSKPGAEPTGVTLIKGLSGMPHEIIKTMLKLGDLGPWSLHNMLEEGAKWNWPFYRETVLSSIEHTEIPCLGGCYPVTYFIRHGTPEDMERLLDLNPEVVLHHELSGRPLLFDLLYKEGTDRMLAACLRAGASPDEHAANGASLMVVAMRASNHFAVRALFEAGYDHDADPCIDRVTIDLYLTQQGVPPANRVAMDEIKAEVPARSMVNSRHQEIMSAFTASGKRTGH